MPSDRVSPYAFLGGCAFLFTVSTALTMEWCTSMSAMGGMPMPGGWTMSMMWMRMPGQNWPAAAASFLGMWGVMMVAMMLPSLAPMLWRYRQAIAGTAASAEAAARCTEAPRRRGETRPGRLAALVGAGYFFVWIVFGLAAFALGVVLTSLEMQQPALARVVPIGVGVIVVIAGALQFSAWKMRHLACCRDASAVARGDVSASEGEIDAGRAWRDGLRLGVHCCYCCAGLMAILLVVGVMDLSPHGPPGGGHHPRTPRTGRSARRTPHRSRRGGDGTDSDRASRRSRVTHRAGSR